MGQGTRLGHTRFDKPESGDTGTQRLNGDTDSDMAPYSGSVAQPDRAQLS